MRTQRSAEFTFGYLIPALELNSPSPYALMNAFITYNKIASHDVKHSEACTSVSVSEFQNYLLVASESH